MRILLLLTLLAPAFAEYNQAVHQRVGASADFYTTSRSIASSAVAGSDSVLIKIDLVITSAFRHLQADAQIAQQSAGSRAADSLFVAARQRFHTRIDSIGFALWNNSMFQKQLRTRTTLQDSLATAWGPRGVRITSSEGSYFPAVNTASLAVSFRSSLSAQGRQYVNARVADEAVPLSDDAALLIPWTELARRAARWESLADSLSGSVFEREAEQWHALYRSILFTGLDNARVFDLETGVVSDSVRAAYAFARDSLSNSKVATDAADFLELLRRETWRETAAVKEFLIQRRVQSMRGMQPPGR